MLKRRYCNCMLGPKDVPPSRSDFEVVGVFNPGVEWMGDRVALVLRVAERPREKRAGSVALPRWENNQIVIDWLSSDDVEYLDPRVVRCRRSGTVRLTFTSHLVVAWSTDGRRIDKMSSQRWLPSGEMEEFGIEDPRVTKIDGKFASHGTAHSVSYGTI